MRHNEPATMLFNKQFNDSFYIHSSVYLKKQNIVSAKCARMVVYNLLADKKIFDSKETSLHIKINHFSK